MAAEWKSALAVETAIRPVATDDRSTLDGIVEEARRQTSEEGTDGKACWLKDLIEEVVNGQLVDEQLVVSKDTEEMINRRIAEIDALISRQLNDIMHAEPFQRLEASWRGLHYFVHETETSSSLNIKLLNASKSDLLKDLDEPVEFDHTQLFNKICEQDYGTVGDKPFGALIGDYEFGPHSQDVALLEKVSGVAATAHAPFIAAASPAMFNFESFSDLAGPRDLEKIFGNEVYLKWNTFRKSDESRYVGLCLPHVLLRLPYGKETVSVEEFDYEEDADGRDHSKYLWGNAAYAFAARLTDAFARHQWCAAIRGVDGGGLVEDLPLHNFNTDEGNETVKCPTEIAITDRRANELGKLGFIPLCYYNRDTVFLGAHSANKAKQYGSADVNASARLSAHLQYVFAVSRFAHFMKVMMRDKLRGFMSRENCESFLNKWIQNYVLLDDAASQDVKAKFPLRDGRIHITEIPGKPRAYNAVAFLRPHFQLDEVAMLRIVVTAHTNRFGVPGALDAADVEALLLHQAQRDLNRTPSRPRSMTVDCPSFSRFAAGFESGWTITDIKHFEECAYCQKISAAFHKHSTERSGREYYKIL
jgi:type VI secretion system protein ImpC